MATKPFPTPDIPIVDLQTGRMTTAFYDYLQSRDRMKVADIRDISTTAPTNGQTLIYNSTSKLWVPGAN